MPDRRVVEVGDSRASHSKPGCYADDAARSTRHTGVPLKSIGITATSAQYLLHFERSRHARHYIGFTENLGVASPTTSASTVRASATSGIPLPARARLRAGGTPARSACSCAPSNGRFQLLSRANGRTRLEVASVTGVTEVLPSATGLGTAEVGVAARPSLAASSFIGAALMIVSGMPAFRAEQGPSSRSTRCPCDNEGRSRPAAPTWTECGSSTP
jgi:hypothetical protein